MRYTNWGNPLSQNFCTFYASLEKIHRQMSDRTLRWNLDAAARLDPEADFKLPKLNHYITIIQAKGIIEPPEFFLIGPNKIDIMDGRHRVYALHDLGYSEILVQCALRHETALKSLIGN